MTKRIGTKCFTCVLLLVGLSLVGGFAPLPQLPTHNRQRVTRFSAKLGPGKRVSDLFGKVRTYFIRPDEIRREVYQERLPDSLDLVSPSSIIVRPMTQNELKTDAGTRKLLQAAEMCVKEMFGTVDEAAAVGESFLIKYASGGLSLSKTERKSVMFVAEEDNELVGCCGIELMMLTPTGKPWWKGKQSEVRRRPFITDMCVSPEYRRKGLAKRLLSECENIATSIWAEELRLSSPSSRIDTVTDRVFLKVSRSNVPALSLYGACGYTVVDYEEQVSGASASTDPFTSADVQGFSNTTITDIYLAKDIA